MTYTAAILRTVDQIECSQTDHLPITALRFAVMPKEASALTTWKRPRVRTEAVWGRRPLLGQLNPAVRALLNASRMRGRRIFSD